MLISKYESKAAKNSNLKANENSLLRFVKLENPIKINRKVLEEKGFKIVDGSQNLKPASEQLDLKTQLKTAMEGLPEDLQVQLWQNAEWNEDSYKKPLFGGLSGALGFVELAREEYKKDHTRSASEIYNSAWDAANKIEYGFSASAEENAPVSLLQGAFSSPEQNPREVRRSTSQKRFGKAGMLVSAFSILTLAMVVLAACNDKTSSNQQDPGVGDDNPPYVQVAGTVSDVFEKNIDLSAIQNTIQNLAKDKILASIDGAKDLETITSRTAIVEMADGTSQLFDINAQLSEEDMAFLEEIEEEIYAIVGLDPDATVFVADEAATAEKLESAAEVYVNLAKSLIQNASLSSTKLAEIDETLELRVDVPEFRGFEDVVFSSMTESMAFTSEGNLESENCTMSYAFGINADGSITAFVVTYADNGETAQEKIDNLANPGAAIISEVGTFPAGVDFTSQLPQLVQREEQISFENAYGQVFGDFAYSDVTTQLKNLTSQVFGNSRTVIRRL